jgi:transcriptional regulator with XRE-family HTH domain
MVPLNDTSHLLAQAVRAYRESRGLSLGNLAEKAGISKASLSKIEAGHGNPSLEVLRRIAEALNVPTGALLAGENRPQLRVIRSNEGQFVTSDSGLSIRPLFVEGRSHRTNFEEVHLPAQTTYDSLAHLPGTLEFVLCLAGDLLLGPAGQEVSLQAGDAVWYSADLPHTYSSVTGARALVTILSPAPALGNW